MGRNDILGSWKSVLYTDLYGNIQKYDRQELTFYADGTGNMHAKTLFKRNTRITREYLGRGYGIYDLGGPGLREMLPPRSPRAGIMRISETLGRKR